MQRFALWLLVAACPWAGSALALQGGVPTNDACADAVVISTNQYDATSNTSTAGNDATDPTPSCGNASTGKSVWYAFTAPAVGTITVNTFGSEYDTILSAYSGSCDALVPAPEECNDDDPRDGAQSQVSFVADAEVTYYFMVSAYEDDGGVLALRLSFLRFPACVGDCNLNGTVALSECALCERIHDGDPLSLCPDCDSSGDGSVANNELGLCALSTLGCLTPIDQSDDCDGDGRVAANDIVKIVAILANCQCSSGPGGEAAGCSAVPGFDKQCTGADDDDDGCITGDELDAALVSLFENNS